MLKKFVLGIFIVVFIVVTGINFGINKDQNQIESSKKKIESFFDKSYVAEDCSITLRNLKKDGKGFASFYFIGENSKNRQLTSENYSKRLLYFFDKIRQKMDESTSYILIWCIEPTIRYKDGVYFGEARGFIVFSLDQFANKKRSGLFTSKVKFIGNWDCTEIGYEVHNILKEYCVTDICLGMRYHIDKKTGEVVKRGHVWNVLGNDVILDINLIDVKESYDKYTVQYQTFLCGDTVLDAIEKEQYFHLLGYDACLGSDWEETRSGSVRNIRLFINYRETKNSAWKKVYVDELK